LHRAIYKIVSIEYITAALFDILKGFLCGVFGSDRTLKVSFESSIAKKSEVEGIIVYNRNESGLRYSFLDDGQFPEKIQGYSRIASLSDFCYYLYPPNGKLTPQVLRK
jgi:hypothetical protein